MEKIKFNELNLKAEVLKSIEEMGFEEPSEIQAKVIPFILQGFDIIGQAQTGTGKTLAYGAPMLSNLVPEGKVKVLILTPTRELSIQVNDELMRISSFMKRSILPVYGGQPIDRQLRALKKGVDIVVGTPGRLLDHIRRESLDLSSVDTFILDEADEMLNMGFIDDIKEIMSKLEEDRQTMLFSATMPEEIRRLASRYMKPDTKQISVIKNTLTVSLTKQFYYEVKARDRFESLCRIIDVESPESAIIFCRTKKGVDELVESLKTRGYSIEGMHGDMNQNQRLTTLKRFKDGKLDFLAATDVAARGIDIENVTHVINYDLPEDSESYVHRIGRTGRANKEGTAFSLVTPREYMTLKQIERVTKSKIKRREIPTIDDIYETKYKTIIAKVKEEIKKDDFAKYVPLAAELDEEFNLVDVAASLMKLMFEKELSMDYSENSITSTDSYSVRYFMNLGRLDKIDSKTVFKFLVDNGVQKTDIGSIDILEKFSFVDVSGESKDLVVPLSGKKMNKKKVNFEAAKGKK